MAADSLLNKRDPRLLPSKDPPIPTQPSDSETSWQWAQPLGLLSCGPSLAGGPHQDFGPQLGGVAPEQLGMLFSASPATGSPPPSLGLPGSRVR